jgi:hypothetical protein
VGSLEKRSCGEPALSEPKNRMSINSLSTVGSKFPFFSIRIFGVPLLRNYRSNGWLCRPEPSLRRVLLEGQAL